MNTVVWRIYLFVIPVKIIWDKGLGTDTGQNDQRADLQPRTETVFGQDSSNVSSEGNFSVVSGKYSH